MSPPIFILLLRDSTCLGVCDYDVELIHWPFHSWFAFCWSYHNDAQSNKHLTHDNVKDGIKLGEHGN